MNASRYDEAFAALNRSYKIKKSSQLDNFDIEIATLSKQRGSYTRNLASMKRACRYTAVPSILRKR